MPVALTTPRPRYRLRMRPVTRALRTAVLLIAGAFFVPCLVGPVPDWTWRLLGVVGLASTLWALRIVLGPAVQVRDDGLRVTRTWPRHQDIAWYRVFAVDVVPGAWTLDVELNSGERIELPCVERFDDLYEQIEDRRHHLDAD